MSVEVDQVLVRVTNYRGQEIYAYRFDNGDSAVVSLNLSDTNVYITLSLDDFERMADILLGVDA